MKNHLISNTLMSCVIFLTLLLLDATLIDSLPVYYYVAVLFFFSIYTIQSTLIYSMSQTPSSFNLIYNLTTMLKMLFSLSFLVIYFLVLEKTSNTTETITFSLFFITTYFIYLIFNTKLFFTNKHEK